MGHQFYIPELPRLIPVAYHPNAIRVEATSNRWVRRFLAGCFATESDLLYFLRQRNGLFGALTVPDADAERARCVSDWWQLVRAVDAAGESDLPAMLIAQLQVTQPTDRVPVGDGYAGAAMDFLRRIAAGISQAQHRRLDDDLGTVHAARKTPSPPDGPDTADLTTYLDRRGRELHYRLVGLLTEYALGVDMTAFAGTPAFEEVHQHAFGQMIIVTDVLSYRTMQYAAATANAVRLLIEHDGMTLQAAVDRLVAFVAAREREYVGARSRILASPLGNRDDVVAYLVGLDHFVAGSQEFDYLTPRHFGDGAVWEGAYSGWCGLDEPVTRLRATADQPADHR